MRTEKDVEAYLLRMKRHFRTVDDQPGTYLIETAPGMPPVAVRVDPPLVVFRVNVGDSSRSEHAPLFRALLEHNAKTLVHASYGLESDRIVLSAAHELENLDFNEFEATLDEIDVVLAGQVPTLMKFART